MKSFKIATMGALLCAAGLLSQSASAASYEYSGVTGPATIGSPFGSPGVFAYNAFEFTASTTANYSFLSTSTYDIYTFLYSSFDPAHPTANVVASGTSGLSSSLTQDNQYVFVNAASFAGQSGPFTTTISTADNTLPILAAVPEPETYAMLLAGMGLFGLVARRRHIPRSLRHSANSALVPSLGG